MRSPYTKNWFSSSVVSISCSIHLFISLVWFLVHFAFNVSLFLRYLLYIKFLVSICLHFLHFFISFFNLIIYRKAYLLIIVHSYYVQWTNHIWKMFLTRFYFLPIHFQRSVLTNTLFWVWKNLLNIKSYFYVVNKVSLSEI